MGKFAILLHAQPGDMGRAVHGLLYTKELHEAGHEVQLIFDGAGTTWVKEFENPEHKYHTVYKEVKAQRLIGGACEYCARAFKVDSEVAKSGIKFSNECAGHPSVANLVQQGYTVIVL